ncbi:TOBE domain-containing protein [Marinospirillum perlucidum]|uniref:TOBE domain-containing protein n=1 Tax=Marinospirillum perlucidum TaxID=1982602 RepID=UPI000DF2D3D1|nr:TOBE domain-containing protein [Marinospirillum perlucidum]
MLPSFNESFVSRLQLENSAGAALSDSRIQLLEAIDRLGSINQAAKAVPLSYKAAWEAIDLLNNTSPQPLVEKTAGGRRGGGTQLTDYGRRMVSLYRALEGEYQATLKRMLEGMNGLEQGSLGEFQQLMRRLSMRASARNQFIGSVVALRARGLNYQVNLQLCEGQELVCLITQASAEQLQLSLGREYFALFKAAGLKVTTQQTVIQGYANQLWGEVVARTPQEEQLEVELALPGGLTLVAVIAAGDSEGIEIGEQACACFDAEQVILVACD